MKTKPNQSASKSPTSFTMAKSESRQRINYEIKAGGRKVLLDNYTYVVLKDGWIDRFSDDPIPTALYVTQLDPQLKHRLKEADPLVKRRIEKAEKKIVERLAQVVQFTNEKKKQNQVQRQKRKEKEAAINALQALKIKITNDGKMEVGSGPGSRSDWMTVRKAINTLKRK